MFEKPSEVQDARFLKSTDKQQKKNLENKLTSTSIQTEKKPHRFWLSL